MFHLHHVSRISALCLAFLCLAPASRAQASGAISLGSFGAFATPSSDWQLAAGLSADPRHDTTLATTVGAGLLINNASGGARSPLTTQAEFGDAVLDLDFLLTPNADVIVYVQGRYALQLSDGRATVPAPADAGRAPGLWQHLHLEFIATRFDSTGQKTAPARFAKVVLNGFTIHENLDLPGPTAGSPLKGDAARGPLVFAGGRGAIAVRALHAAAPSLPKPLSTETAPAKGKGKNAAKKAQKSPPKIAQIPIDVTDSIMMQRGFVPYEPTKRLYATSVGTPAGVHYAYDFETAALLRVWRGRFIDAGEMWEGRSPNQWAKPTGPALTLNALPTIAVLGSAGWSVEADPLAASQGYEVERDGQPVFVSTFGALKIRDRIAPTADKRGLARTLTFSGKLPAVAPQILLARAKAITAQPGGTGFIVGDRSYYLDLPPDLRGRATVRTVGDVQLLLVPVDAAALAQPITYTLVW